MDGQRRSSTASRTKHPSLEFEMQEELTKLVRQYAKGLINFQHITPFPYPKDDSLKEFGDMTAKELQNSIKRKKRKKNKPSQVVFSPALLASLDGEHVSEAQLAKLAEQARLAIEQAERQAGERVVYCCGNLRLENKIDYECECTNSIRHQAINNG